MSFNFSKSRSRIQSLTPWIILGGIISGILIGFLVVINPIYLLALILVIFGVTAFFLKFEITVLTLLIIRSSLDIFSDYQIPSAFALAVIALTVIYIIIQLFTRQPLITDKVWWFLAFWLILQGLWVILLPLGGLGLDGSYLSLAIREWIRLLSWVTIYLLVIQLKGKIAPQTIVSLLFLGLVIPCTVAMVQIILPSSVLPSFLVVYPSGAFDIGSRINGTLGHPNTFTTFTFLFMALTYWKQSHTKNRQLWLIVLGIVAFFFVGAKALFGLMMLGTWLLCHFVRRASLLNIFGGLILFGLVIALFASTPFGQERLGSLSQTPIFNPDINLWTGILTSKWDGNSFNWRLAQWHYLLQQWQNYPLLGYGLGVNKLISANGLEPHGDYVRFLVETGVIGFMVFLGFWWGQLAYLFHLMRTSIPGSMKQDFCFTLVSIMIALSIGMITENIWSHTTLFFYWFTFLAIAGWDWNEEKLKK